MGSDRLGRKDGKTVVEHWTEWLEDGIVESYIGRGNWGPENEHGGSKEGSLNVTNLPGHSGQWTGGMSRERIDPKGRRSSAHSKRLAGGTESQVKHWPKDATSV